MMAIVFALAAVSGSSSAKGQQALSDYDFCVAHNAIIAQRDKAKSVESVVKQGFEGCKAKRTSARKAIATMQTSAKQTSDEMMDENDRQLAEELKSEISEYRRTGKIPNNAQN
jgi:DNA-binding ferritin-like protein